MSNDDVPKHMACIVRSIDDVLENREGKVQMEYSLYGDMQQ